MKKSINKGESPSGLFLSTTIEPPYSLLQVLLVLRVRTRTRNLLLIQVPIVATLAESDLYSRNMINLGFTKLTLFMKQKQNRKILHSGVYNNNEYYHCACTCVLWINIVYNMAPTHVF
jgi:hypothetical protein